VDVAFSVGTLAINSIVPDAFSAIELRQLTKLAEVLDGGFRRLADLKRLASSEARFRALVESSGGGRADGCPQWQFRLCQSHD
jgi:hypothetical protein